ncbi:MAG TPA: glycoside hydrolase family 16 protein [Pirellulales bacterium]|jgi:hypothetical protein|nr:glycoside hydrolase family 16 protein [Pirellulales bacterium]
MKISFVLLQGSLLLLLVAGFGTSVRLPAAEPAAHEAAKPLVLDDFEGEPKHWKFIGGEEFPGAKGALTKDNHDAHGGKSCYRLEADFKGGGAYVGCWKDLEPLGLPDLEAIRLWVKTKDLTKLGVRVVDDSGQCHQKTVELPAESDKGWRELTLSIRDLVGGEHWAGANDGHWHGPAKGFGFNIGKDAVANAGTQAELWIDDVSAIPLPAGKPTLAACTLDPTITRPGFGTKIHYVWEAQPLGAKCSIFVHFVNAKGQMVAQADHDPPVSTIDWSGKVEYDNTAVLPTNILPGKYDVVVGLWNPKPAAVGGGNKPFAVGAGLKALEGNACRVGTLEVAADAPLPKLPPKTLRLDQFKLTFDESFQAPLSVSAHGPGTRWTTHTPYGGDFGDAGFADPEKDFPFTIKNGVLQIEAKKFGDRWRTGFLCSVDPKGNGFSQQYGYFEMRAKLPKGLGTWPAFWLNGIRHLKETDKSKLTNVEIDVLEQYGVNENAMRSTIHLWGPGQFHWAIGDATLVPDMVDDFHSYGVLVEEDLTRIYFDGSEVQKWPTPKEAKVPLYIMVDLALGGGWPIKATPNPSHLLVEHIRAYQKK